MSVYNNGMTAIVANIKTITTSLRRFAQNNKLAACAIVLGVATSSVAATYTLPSILQNTNVISSETATNTASPIKDQSTGIATQDNTRSQTASDTPGEGGSKSPSNNTASPSTKEAAPTAKSPQQSGGASTSPSPSAPSETPEQIYTRDYKNLLRAYYSLSPALIRTESDGYIYYTVTLHVEAFDAATFGRPTLFAQLVPSIPNRYSCVNPVGTMATFVYGTNGNTVSISCKIRACPECYYPGGPLPYYGAFSVSFGGLTSNGTPTGTGTPQSYDLLPGYDKPL